MRREHIKSPQKPRLQRRNSRFSLQGVAQSHFLKKAALQLHSLFDLKLNLNKIYVVFRLYLHAIHVLVVAFCEEPRFELAVCI